MIGRRRSLGPVALVCLVFVAWSAPAAAPEGQMTWAVHTTLVPGWFDPAEMIIGTPVIVLYAFHDAMMKRMPGNSMAPSLAESWSASPDGLVYEVKLRAK